MGSWDKGALRGWAARSGLRGPSREVSGLQGPNHVLPGPGSGPLSPPAQEEEWRGIQALFTEPVPRWETECVIAAAAHVQPAENLRHPVGQECHFRAFILKKRLGVWGNAFQEQMCVTMFIYNTREGRRKGGKDLSPESEWQAMNCAISWLILQRGSSLRGRQGQGQPLKWEKQDTDVQVT